MSSVVGLSYIAYANDTCLLAYLLTCSLASAHSRVLCVYAVCTLRVRACLLVLPACPPACLPTCPPACPQDEPYPIGSTVTPDAGVDGKLTSPRRHFPLTPECD